MKKLVSVTLVLCMMLSLAACGSSSNAEGTAKKGVLVMATNAEFPPYEYHEGDDIVGIDAEIAAAIAQRLGCELKIEDIAFDSIIPAVVSGKADIGLAGMTVTEDRKKSVDFSDSYASSSQVVIVKEDSGITGLGDLGADSVVGDIVSIETYHLLIFYNHLHRVLLKLHIHVQHFLYLKEHLEYLF